MSTFTQQLARLGQDTLANLQAQFGSSAEHGMFYYDMTNETYRIGLSDNSLSKGLMQFFEVSDSLGAKETVTHKSLFNIEGLNLLKTVKKTGGLQIDFNLTGGSAYKVPRIRQDGTKVEWADALTIGAGSNGILTFVDGVLNIDKIGVVDVFTDNTVTNTGVVDSALNAYIALNKCSINSDGVLEVTEDRGAGVQTYKIEHGDLVVLVAAKESWVCTGLSGTSAGFAKMSADFSEAAILAMLSGGEGVSYNNTTGAISLEYLRKTNSNLEFNDGTSWDKVWTSKNDGIGSGLNADKLDGREAIDFMLTSNVSKTDPNIIVNGGFKYEINSNNPTTSYYAINTFGNRGNVTGQLATHFLTGDLWSRAYNTSWSNWKRFWSSEDFTTADITAWNNSKNLQGVLTAGNTSNVDIHLNATTSKIGLGGLGTSGTGGWFQGTGESGTGEAGYGSWMTNNLYFNGTNWTKPCATTTAIALSVNHHKDFSIYGIGAGGSDGDTYSFSNDTYRLLNLRRTGDLYVKDGGTTLLQVATRKYVTDTINTQYFNDLGDTDADKLGGQSPSYYRNPANFTWSLANGYLPYFDGSSLADSNIIQDPNGFSLAAQKYFVGSLGIGGQPVGEFDVTGTLRSNHNIAANNAYNIFAIRSNRQINDYGGLNKDYWLLNFKSEVGNHYFGDLIFKASRTNTSTLYDALRISALGQVEASAAGRFKGWMDSKSTGLGAEIGISGGQGYLTAYDRTTSTYSNFNINIGNGEGLHLNASTYRVGIHNASPGYTLDVTGDINATAKYTGGTNSTTHRNFLDLSYSASKASVALLFPNSSRIEFKEDGLGEGRMAANFGAGMQIENTGDIFFNRAGNLEATITEGLLDISHHLKISGLTGNKYLFADVNKKVVEKTIDDLKTDILGSANNSIAFSVTQSGHGFSIGTMVYWDGTEWVGSIADTEAHVKYSVGVVVEVADVDNFIIGTQGIFNVGTHGFTVGKNYAVSTTTQGVVDADTLSIGSDIIWFAFIPVSDTKFLIQNFKYVV